MMALTSNVFGFPDFRSLIELKPDGTVHFSAGMVAEEPGVWNVVPGDPEERESQNEIYLKFTQPLTRKYKKVFSVPGGTCFWKTKIVVSNNIKKAKFEDGQVVSNQFGGKGCIREGTFMVAIANEELVKTVRSKSKEAYEKALTIKGESTGFKTPARIAGVRKQIGGKNKFLDGPEDAKALKGGKKALEAGKKADDDDVQKQ